MARLPFLSRSRPTEGRGDAASPSAMPRRALPAPGTLRRERRALLRVRDERLHDLGGLMLEMYRRDQFREDLLVERCLELVSLDDRLQELDTLLAAASVARRRPPAARCECGRPIPWGARFCPSCGRPLDSAEAGGSPAPPAAGSWDDA